MKLSQYLAGLLAAIASCSVFAAPLLSEGFNDISTLPASGWVLFNDSTPPGSTDWFQGNPAIFTAAAGPADSYIAANFNNAAFGGAVSNWLMTPELALLNGESLNFALRLLGEGQLDRVEIYLSTSGASASIADFSLLTAFESDSDTGWVGRSAVVSGLALPASGRFAFRYVVDDTSLNGDYIGIDSVSVNATAIPAPGSVALVLLGMAAMVGVRRRKDRQPRRWPAMAALGLSALGVAAATAQAAQTGPDGVMRFDHVQVQRQPVAAVQSAKPEQDGLKAYKDPATGQLSSPTAEQAAALDAAAPPSARRSAAAVARPAAHGGKAIMLDEEHDSQAVATRDADGGLSEVCVPNHSAALAVIKGERP